MKTIYFNIYRDKQFNQLIICTSYTNDGYMSDHYDDEDYERLYALEKYGICEVSDSSFEVPEGMSKEEVISLMDTMPGFVYEPKVGNIK